MFNLSLCDVLAGKHIVHLFDLGITSHGCCIRLRIDSVSKISIICLQASVVYIDRPAERPLFELQMNILICVESIYRIDLR